MPPAARRSRVVKAVPTPPAVENRPRPDRIPTRPAIVAAAQQIVGQKIKRPELSKQDADWQAEIWRMYDEVGELHFGLRWKAQACSRLRLVAALSGDEPEPIVIDKEGPNAPDDVKAVEIAQQFAGGTHGRSKLLRSAAIHIDAVGESFIVVYAETGDVVAYAPGDIKVQQNVYSAGGVELSDDDLLLHPRVAHPSICTRVDSPVRPAIPVLRELHGLNQQLLGAIDSRLAGAGLLVVPQSVSPPKKPPTPDDESTVPETESEQDPFLVALIEAMMTPISDRESAAAVVPLVVRVPDEVIGKIQHIIFAQPFDPELRALRDEAVRRLAMDMDMPPEILLGTGDVNHWGQWAIDESAIKFNIVPTAQVIVDSVVDDWYRPALEQAGIEDSTKYTLLIDASELEQRVDKSEKAVQAYDRAEIKGETYRREAGFSEDDKPSDEERAEIVALHVALAGHGAAPMAPGDAPVADTRAIPDLPGAAAVDPTSSSQLPPEARMHSLVDAAHVAVLRALELAGKRHIAQDRSLRNGVDVPLHKVHTRYEIKPDRTDFLLKGAWEALGTVASPCAVKAVADYTRELLLAGDEHHRAQLAPVFSAAGCSG